MSEIVFNRPDLNMQFFPSVNPHKSLEIPESWEDVKEFADWWMESGMPIMFPPNPEVFMSDDATAIALFRHKRFQVELYLIHPQPAVPEHEHPGVEVIKMRLGNSRTPLMSGILHRGQSHGAGLRLEAEDKGFPLIAFQYWQDREPCTVAAMWKGKTVGPMQEALIKRFHPDAYVVDGYADITRKMDED